jgi:hypothetical protein
MGRNFVLLILICTFVAGCGRTSSRFMQGMIDSMEAGILHVDCTDEVNKGKKTDFILLVGYSCAVAITDQTTFRDEDGKSLTAEDFPSESTVKIIFSEPVNIRRSFEKEEPLNLAAKEIILIQPDF